MTRETSDLTPTVDKTTASEKVFQHTGGKPFRLFVATLWQELFSGQVTYVEVPGESGALGVLAGHTPLLTQVAPGMLRFQTAQHQAREIAVFGGIIEIAPWGTTILADMAGRDAETEKVRIEKAKERASVHIPFAERPIGAEAVRAELDTELVRFFVNALRKDH